MRKRCKLFAALAAAALAVCPLSGTLTAGAAAPEDVLAAISGAGWPDWMVQQAANQLGSGSFTAEQCDQMIAQISEYDADMEKQIWELLNPSAPAATAVTTTALPVQGNVTTATETVQTQNQSRPADKAFIQMTLEEKKAYLSSLSGAERQAFLDNLTPEQISVSDKAELVAGFIDIAGEFGLSFNIDELTGDNISISAYDADGNLVNVSSMNMTIDPTGTPYTLPAAAAAGLMLVSAGGIYLVIRRSRV